MAAADDAEGARESFEFALLIEPDDAAARTGLEKLD